MSEFALIRVRGTWNLAAGPREFATVSKALREVLERFESKSSS
jgi:hypothetical protein